MKIEISNSCIETMRKLGMIHDYTDDGYVLHGQGGWVPAGDVIEYYLGMEEYEVEQAKEKIATVERRKDKAQEKN